MFSSKLHIIGTFATTTKFSFLFSGTKLFVQLNNRNHEKVSFCSLLKNHLFWNRHRRFNRVIYEGRGKGGGGGKERNLLLEEDAYENNECVYLKNDKRIIIKKNKNNNGNLNSDKKRNEKNGTNEKKNENINVNVNEIVNVNVNENVDVNINVNINEIVNDNVNENDNLITIFQKDKEIKEENKLQLDNTKTPVVSYDNNNNMKLDVDTRKKDIHSEKQNEALMRILTEEDNDVMIQKEKRFCDFLWVTVKSGKGGAPNYKVQRSKKLKGEGYGGNGGNIILKSKNSIYDLIKIEQKIKGNDGEDFKENSRGKDGKDIIVYVPIGTIVRKRIYIKKKNINNRKIYKSIFWFQFLKENEEMLVARGGKGGISYSYFKKHDYRLPENGEKVRLELELRLMNDVAFIGIENSGKTSLCSSLSKYYGNISDSPFSTTIPHVSNINYIDGVQISLLDTPYLFLNAHKDKDKGKRILRHLYRSKLIVYVVDVSSSLLTNQDDSQMIEYDSQEQQNEHEKEIYYKKKDNDTKKNNEKINGADVNADRNEYEYIYEENCEDINDNGTNIYTNTLHSLSTGTDTDTCFSNNDTGLTISESKMKKKKKKQQKWSDEKSRDQSNFNNYYTDTLKQIKMLRKELYLYNKDFLKKKELVVATKCEMLHKNSLLNLDSLYYRLQNVFPHMEVIGTSAKFGLGIKLLSRKIRELIYPQYVLQNEKWYAKNIEDYVIPTYTNFEKGRQRLKSYELPENIKHIYDFNYLENLDFFLKGKKNESFEKSEKSEKNKNQESQTEEQIQLIQNSIIMKSGQKTEENNNNNINNYSDKNNTN